ncbi:MAG: hypothetical protein M1818_007217 [Claussenomyces sp. TS43310]|nr:MAG: hypothetical protein M1818_007217 [Claussenomyces sp. TS43310]
MAAALEDTPVTYEDLADIEQDFDHVETEIIRQQVKLTGSLYERRQKTVAQIPNFWALVLEQAPPDIDQYIQPSDSALLLTRLTSLYVSHFEIEGPDSSEHGHPRSFSIKLEFAENDYFEDTVLEKKFWYRRAKDGWAGLVSEPVPVKWKKGKDLTNGLLDLACAAREAEKRGDAAQATSREAEQLKLNSAQEALRKAVEKLSLGGLSFFNWFGYIGRRITADESAEATKLEAERREKKRQGQKAESSTDEADDEEDILPGDLDMALEIFPGGDELALAFNEDLWPDAIQYFSELKSGPVEAGHAYANDEIAEAQEEDGISDSDFESEDQDLAVTLQDNLESGEDKPPAKKQRT